MQTRALSHLFACASLATLLACGGAEEASNHQDGLYFPHDEPGPVTVTYEETSEEILNPERGFYIGIDLFSETEAAAVREQGHTLAIALVRLDGYRGRAIDAELLAALDAGFERVRGAGIKVILRFMYNSSFGADAPRERVLEHIAQLAPHLRANADVISVLQAGFIGAWGEWHGSSHGLDNDGDRSAILGALLEALPASRAVQIRAPMYKEAAFPGGPVSEGEAYDQSLRARVGHHNDCFLASENDLGTYEAPVERWMDYVADDTRFTPMGGETCALNQPRTGCEAALGEMEALHFSYLNSEYNLAVLDSWNAEGCEDEIERRLGYRFALDSVVHSEAVRPGGVLRLGIELVNHGFASPFNERPVFVVLTGAGGEQHVARLGAESDPRRWAGGAAITVEARLRVPADATPGDYELALWLPDEDHELARDPRHAIRLASEGVWDAETGRNVLTRTLRIDPAVAGRVDRDASRFEEIRD